WLWTEQQGARRLTIHEAYEHTPIFSPDGSSLAFVSDRYGNDDIFTIGTDGQDLQRITWRSGGDRLTSWEAGLLLFESNRDYRALEWDGEIQVVSADGGTPFRAMEALGKQAVLSPDGRKVVFVSGSCRIDREAYRGSANLDLYLYDTETGEYEQLTSFEGNDFMPKWSGHNTLYFISSRSGRYNVYRMELGGEPVAVTSETEFGVYQYDVNDAGDLVYGSGMNLIRQSASGVTEIIRPELTGDYRFDPVVTEVMTSGVSEYAISPSNTFAAVGMRGELFVTETDKDKDRAVNISNHVWRDRDVAWLNDSTAIFSSDRDGNYELYVAFSTDPAKPQLVES
ncbi:MAG: peptidase S41, partial [Bacteroidetes bacterium]|nr:peptidase S41 [Bacteroidota bacterium]